MLYVVLLYCTVCLTFRLSEYRLIITEPEATNCFSINFQVSNNQLNFIKIHFDASSNPARDNEFFVLCSVRLI